MQKIINYFKDTYSELVNKVSWPTFTELQASSSLVMISSFIIAIIVYIMDVIFSKVIEFIYELM